MVGQFSGQWGQLALIPSSSSSEEEEEEEEEEDKHLDRFPQIGAPPPKVPTINARKARKKDDPTLRTKVGVA